MELREDACHLQCVVSVRGSVAKSVGSRAIILVQIIILLLPSNVISVNLFYLFWDSIFLSVKWA